MPTSPPACDRWDYFQLCGGDGFGQDADRGKVFTLLEQLQIRGPLLSPSQRRWNTFLLSHLLEIFHKSTGQII